MENILLIPLFVGFFVTLFFIPFWIKRARRANLVGKDIHKTDGREIAEGGGLSVLFGFVLGLLIYIFIKTFILQTNVVTIEIFALLVTILIAGGIGFIDDILGWRIGLNKEIRILLLIFASIPLVVINAGESTMMGIQFGLWYPLFLIPLGIVGATATFNFIEGYNGLGTSQGIIILSGLAIVTWLTGSSWLSLILLIMVACLIGFYVFNKCPAKVLPGDSLTYSVGALIGVAAIIGNIEKIAIFFFIPYILETILKVRGKLKKQSFAKLREDGGLILPYEKFYGLEHIAIYVLQKIKKGKKVKEKEVVRIINLFQILIILLGFVLLRGTIF